MVAKKKTQTSAQALRTFRKILEDLTKDEVAARRFAPFRFPNSDFYEYCAGCGQSPYANPQHLEGCMVVRIHEALHTPIRDRKPKAKSRYAGSMIRYESTDSKA